MQICENFIINNTNGASQFFFDDGIPELNLIAWCQQYLNEYENFVDIDAHTGTWSCSLAPYCNNVFAFESSRLTYYQLCGSVSLHGYRNIFPFHIGLGDESLENCVFFQTTHDGGGSTFIKPQADTIRYELEDINTLDSYNLDSISLIKIDVEGFELNVLKGATQTLIRSNYPKIVFESNIDNEDRKELFDYLISSLGYTIHPINGYSNMFMASR